jgi:hypothetical protein
MYKQLITTNKMSSIKELTLQDLYDRLNTLTRTVEVITNDMLDVKNKQTDFQNFMTGSVQNGSSSGQKKKRTSNTSTSEEKTKKEFPSLQNWFISKYTNDESYRRTIEDVLDRRLDSDWKAKIVKAGTEQEAAYGSEQFVKRLAVSIIRIKGCTELIDLVNKRYYTEKDEHDAAQK